MKNTLLTLLIIISNTVCGQKEIRQIKLSGTGYELGLEHGRLLKK